MKLHTLRFSIERLRNVVLVGGVLLAAAVIAFLFAGQWKRRLLMQDLPRRLGANIELQANGFNYTQTSKGKTLFKIHAERAEQMKQNGQTLLHNVRIELYGADASQVDTIRGAQFEYDQAAGKAVAQGAVEIDLVRPNSGTSSHSLSSVAAPVPAVPGPKAQQSDTIHVHTSGLEFDQKSGIATTTQRVDFSLRQGSGNSIGATYDSNHGDLVLDREVAITVIRPQENMIVHASHAEMERGQQLCHLLGMTANYVGGTAMSGVALIHFRADGSIAQLDGSDNLRLTNVSGAVITAPEGSMVFDNQSHPSHGILQGGTNFALQQPGRNVEGSAPTAHLAFDSQGRMHLAHLEKGVVLRSQEQSVSAKGKPLESRRHWTSDKADLEFAPAVATARQKHSGNSAPAVSGATEPVVLRSIHGIGKVVITSETEGDPESNSPTRMAADNVVAQLTQDSKLSTITGDGHARFEQSTTDGAHQVTNSDHLEAHFTQQTHPVSQTGKAVAANSTGTISEIESIEQTGHVILTNTPPPAHMGAAQQAPLRATAACAHYDGQKQSLHLSGITNQPPRIMSDTFSMSAVTIDFQRQSGDLFGHQNVKASWSGSLTGPSMTEQSMTGQSGTGQSEKSIASRPESGEDESVHAVASEVILHRDSEQAVLLGTAANPAHLWQAANSVSASEITLNRLQQTLDAKGRSHADPVSTVLAESRGDRKAAPQSRQAGKSAGKLPTRAARPGPDASVIRLTSGELHYSEGQRLAVFSSGAMGRVTAETSSSAGLAKILSDSAEVYFMDQGSHFASPSSSGSANSTVDRMISQGKVAVRWPGRIGTGKKLVYTSDDGLFTLTGSAAEPPRIRDLQHGTVTGSALIFNSQDDSVTVEGNGGSTTTDTRTPR